MDYTYDDASDVPARGGGAVVCRVRSRDGRGYVALKRPLPFGLCDERLETVGHDEAVQDECSPNLTGGIEAKRRDALKALRDAEKAYASPRGSIASAKSLGVQHGRFDNAWHTSLVNDGDRNRVLPALKEAIGSSIRGRTRATTTRPRAS